MDLWIYQRAGRKNLYRLRRELLLVSTFYYYRSGNTRQILTAPEDRTIRVTDRVTDKEQVTLSQLAERLGVSWKTGAVIKKLPPPRSAVLGRRHFCIISYFMLFYDNFDYIIFPISAKPESRGKSLQYLPLLQLSHQLFHRPQRLLKLHKLPVVERGEVLRHSLQKLSAERSDDLPSLPGDLDIHLAPVFLVVETLYQILFLQHIDQLRQLLLGDIQFLGQCRHGERLLIQTLQHHQRVKGQRVGLDAAGES